MISLHLKFLSVLNFLKKKEKKDKLALQVLKLVHNWAFQQGYSASNS